MAFSNLLKRALQIALGKEELEQELTTAVENASDGLGNHTATQDLDMSGNKVVDVGAPSIGTDAANKDYVDTEVSGAGGANPSLSNLTDPTSVNQNLMPDSHNTRDMGSDTNSWNLAYFKEFRIVDSANTLFCRIYEAVSQTVAGETMDGILIENPSNGGRDIAIKPSSDGGGFFVETGGNVEPGNIKMHTGEGFSGNSGDWDLRTGPSSSNSGNINLGVGAASGSAGKINLIGARAFNIDLTTIPTHADDTAAGVAGLDQGDLYKTLDGSDLILKIKS